MHEAVSLVVSIGGRICSNPLACWKAGVERVPLKVQVDGHLEEVALKRRSVG